MVLLVHSAIYKQQQQIFRMPPESVLLSSRIFFSFLVIICKIPPIICPAGVEPALPG